MKTALTSKSETASLIRFLLVGGSFSLFYTVTSAGLINYAGTPPLWTSILLFAACIPPAFLAQKNIAFKAKGLRKNAFLIYAVTQIFSITFVALITTRFVTYNMAWDTLIMGITVSINAVIGFTIGRFVTFRPQK